MQPTENTMNTENTMTTMNAIVQQAYGLDALAIAEQPMPSAASGQVRIKVTASTINPMDWHLATGTPGIVRLVEGLRRPRHQIPGREASGVVDQVGAGVSDFEIGQPVFGWVIGAFAEFAVADADHLCLAPTEMTASECAALPIAGAAALQAIGLGAVDGKRVVVNGASGGVGHFAVQLAKVFGANWVAGVCSDRNTEFVVDCLGADQAIDYNSEDFTSERWDVVIDCIGNRRGSEIRRALSDDGSWVVVGDENKTGLLGPLPRVVARLGRWRFGSRSCHWFVQGEEVRLLRELAGLVDAGTLRCHVSEMLDLRDVRKGYGHIETGRSVGKLVVDVAAGRDAELPEMLGDVEVRS